MHLGTEYGDVEIREEDLSLVPAAELKKFRITRAELRRCFAEAMELMKGATQEDWARRRPVCEETLDGKWEVHGPIGYNQYTHPLMHDDYNGPQETA
jgi:formate-dependent phosphoribosylglycinamide formyltransferase (GAR transformylase)